MHESALAVAGSVNCVRSGHIASCDDEVNSGTKGVDRNRNRTGSATTQ